MRILILTCATGGGHLRAAAALEKYIRETTTHEVIQMDFLKSIGKLLDKTICDSYLFMAKKTPSLFGRLYKTTNKDNPLADFVPRTTELLALQLGQRLRHARLRHAQPAGYVHGADVAVLALQRQHGFSDSLRQTHEQAASPAPPLRAGGRRARSAFPFPPV